MNVLTKDHGTWLIFSKDWNTLGLVMMSVWGSTYVFGYFWMEVINGVSP